MMGLLAVIAAMLLHSSRPPLPDRPPPQPAPVIYTCILDDPSPPPLTRSCEPRTPEIAGVTFLRVCPQWLDKMIAEPERL